MSILKLAPSRAIARSTRSLQRYTVAPTHLQVSPWVQCRLESSDNTSVEERASFKGQLYASTADRLEREREERRKYSRERGESRGGRSAALTFGMTSASKLLNVRTLISQCSYFVLLLSLLLPGNPHSCCPSYRFHLATYCNCTTEA
jgi:hypothetical protein